MVFKIRSVSKDKALKSDSGSKTIGKNLPDLQIVLKTKKNATKLLGNQLKKIKKSSNFIRNKNNLSKSKPLLKNYVFPWKFNRLKAIRSETRRISWNLYLVKMRFNNQQMRFNKSSSSLYLKILTQKTSLIILLILVSSFFMWQS